MSNEVMIQDERPVLMKSGLVHWLKIERWQKLSEMLANQEGHQFIKIPELGNIVINTAQIESTLTLEQYEDHCKIKEGQWQCAYRVWHPKRGECQCKQEYYRKERERKERAQQEPEKPQTPEEREESRKAMILMNEKAALNARPDSIFRTMYAKHNARGRAIRRSTIAAWEKETGQKAEVGDLAINEAE